MGGVCGISGVALVAAGSDGMGTGCFLLLVASNALRLLKTEQRGIDGSERNDPLMCSPTPLPSVLSDGKWYRRERR